jgi:GNAT superfamily N-acetyltransferase
MRHTLNIRRFLASEWEIYRELRLRSLADSPDAFGSTLALEQSRADHEWMQRLASGCDGAPFSFAALALVRDTPAGLAWGRIEPQQPQQANLYQMWVAPDARGIGAGAKLLDAVIAWAASCGVRTLHLGVTCGDTPAHRMYTRAGFRPVGAPELLRAECALLAQNMQLDLPRVANPSLRQAP